jgi:hypothetical protein
LLQRPLESGGPDRSISNFGVAIPSAERRIGAACLQPANRNRSSNHLASMQTPYRDPANEWRSAQERHGQNDIVLGVRRYDLS